MKKGLDMSPQARELYAYQSQLYRVDHTSLFFSNLPR